MKHWNESAFEDSERKDKFLSLLGAKKKKEAELEAYDPDLPVSTMCRVHCSLVVQDSKANSFENSKLFKDLEWQFYQSQASSSMKGLGAAPE